MNRGQNIFIIIIIIISVNVISNFYSYDLDLSQDKKYTLSDNSKKILSKVDDILTIKVYLKGKLPTGFQMLSSSINDFLINCKKENSQIQFEFIDPNDNNETKRQEIYTQLQSQGLFPTDLTIPFLSTNAIESSFDRNRVSSVISSFELSSQYTIT